MISFQLTDEQREFRDAVRDFVAHEVKPAANHPDRLQAGPAPLAPSILEKASRMGLRAMMLSEARGGAGADHLTACIVGEELAAGDIGLAATLARTAELGHALFDIAMSDAQRQQFLPAFLADDACHLAYAGSDGDVDDGGWNYHSHETATIEVPVSVTRHADELVLNGRYDFVANAPLAKLIAVRVCDGGNQAVVVLVPAGTPGMTVREVKRVDTDASGAQVFRAFHGVAGSVSFNDCTVPAAHVLQGCTALSGEAAAHGRGSPLTQALNLGVGRAAFEAAVEYARLRVQGGRLIIQHQAIGGILAEVAIRLETARNLVWKAAWAADNPQEHAADSTLPLQTMAKAYVSQAMEEATLLAAECFGAMGVMKDMTPPHYVNDARWFVHSDVNNATAKLRVAETIAGFQRA